MLMPCKMLSGVVDEIAEEHDDIAVGKVNVDDSPELAERYGVSLIPTLIIFKDGSVSKKSVGYKEKEEILKLI